MSSAPTLPAQPLAYAWRHFWKLNKRRPEPLWTHALISTLMGLLVGLALTVIAALFAGRLGDWAWWPRVLGGTLIVSLTVCWLTTLGYRVAERLMSERFIARLNGKPDWKVGLFFCMFSCLCALVGWLVGLKVATLLGLTRKTVSPLDLQLGQWAVFIGLSTLISVLVGSYAAARWRQQQLRLQAQEAQLKLLQAQIEPHYLFNTLANVRSLIDIDPPAAGELLDAFTDHLRVSLTSMRAELVPLDTELQLVGHYLKLMQLRMGERLRYVIDADAATRQHLLPPLLLQPLVENAIHHGLEPKVEGGTLHLRAHLADGLLHISVQDDGVGLDAPRSRTGSKGHGVATKNIHERLQARYGGRAMLRVAAAQPAGTTGTLAEITLPLNP